MACPSCGYCPTCGRAASPWNPWAEPYPYPAYPFWYTTTVPTQTSINITGSVNATSWQDLGEEIARRLRDAKPPASE